MIVSASRRTDIPAFYFPWLLKRLEEGVALVRNPMNRHQVSRVRLNASVVDCLVLWTKNAGPMLPYLDALEQHRIPYFVQFTLNPYGNDVEPHLPSLQERLDCFRRLSSRLGPDRVVWRYDPVLLSDRYSAAFHEHAFHEIARALSGAANRCVFSFLDFYAKRRKILETIARTPAQEEQRYIAQSFSSTANLFGMSLSTCCEGIDLSEFGIAHGACISKELVELAAGVPIDAKRDSNQRKGCGCLESIDIGSYDTCPYGCVYCYANRGQLAAPAVRKFDASAPMLCGAPEAGDVVRERKMASLRCIQPQIDAI